MPITPARARTYSVASPLATHTRPATCEEVDCQAQAGGFSIPVDPNTDLGRRQIAAIKGSGRHYTTHRTPVGLVEYRFPAGQRCFQQHRRSLDRPEWYMRRQTGNTHRHTGPDPWLNDFGGHLDQLRKHQ